MRTSMAGLAAFFCLLGIVSNASAQSLTAERILTNLSRPVYATHAPSDPNRLFIVEQRSGDTGRIRIFDLPTRQLKEQPFLSISGLSTGGEQGILGFAFHPDYQANGYFYVSYTDANGDTAVRRYTRQTADTADPNSAYPIMSLKQPGVIHNVGWMSFGPDGFLYLGSGDGGHGNDQGPGHSVGGNAQDITINLLGKILRIDVDGDDYPSDHSRNYASPPTNPFYRPVGNDQGDNEIWAYGLRQPWRNSFDRATGNLYIADVGQGSREEINVQPAGSGGGENYGWRLREGTIETPASGIGGPRPEGNVDPIYDFEHDPSSNNAIVGGYVYRGPINALRGHFFFAIFGNNRLCSLKYNGDDPGDFDGTNFTNFTDWTDIVQTSAGRINSVSSFGQDLQGNLYILGLDGEVYLITGGEPAGVTVVNLDQLNIVRGRQSAGDINDVAASDDSHLVVVRGEVAGGGQPLISVELTGVSPTETPSELVFTFEGKANTLGVNRTVELFNFSTGEFETVDTRASTLEDSIVEIQLQGDLSRFVEAGSGAMKGQLNWSPVDPRLVSWTVYIDQTVWTVSQ